MTKKTQPSIEAFLSDPDWCDAFGEAMGVEPDAYCKERRNARRIIGFSGSNEPFARSDVQRIIAISDGVNDGLDWIGLFELNDGRFAFVRAGCDFTGWDCLASGDAEVGSSVDDLVRLALNDEERRRLGFSTVGTSSPTDDEL